MIKIFSPDNSLEAQCLKDLLQSHGISCHLGGSYLSGAIGELPAAGLLALYVEDLDAGRAKQLIEDYLMASPVLEDLTQARED
ncbi:putative signal transducing protein [Endozoicomonas numazuensis]|uniref:DUF2007 domain-containing protein n=1 Tax=Endozoicomonas numazuensis TaxID=1137799 RepID=A0A081NHT1_9GAMM|nr:DUF2007 domain-containing protein [Endozoicomonas numazuensis]KEQ18004.1 hypothetical protein GZ78_10420 [Endozoicomonas numazuensis]